MRLNVYSQELITSDAEAPSGCIEAVQVMQQLSLLRASTAMCAQCLRIRLSAANGLMHSTTGIEWCSPCKGECDVDGEV